MTWIIKKKIKNNPTIIPIFRVGEKVIITGSLLTGSLLSLEGKIGIIKELKLIEGSEPSTWAIYYIVSVPGYGPLTFSANHLVRLTR